MVEFVDINGARLAYRITGPEDGPLIITLHGGRGMGDHRSDFRAYSPLAASGYRVLSFDYRGHGQSSRTGPYTFQQIVKDVEGVRQHFEGKEAPVIICGGSFGGFLAIRYAIEFTKYVRLLVLRGTAASYHQEEGAMEILEQRLHLVPSFTKEMLRDKVFGAYESDIEFQLVHLAMLPLYSEKFDANSALRQVLDGVYNAQAHNDLYSEEEKYFDYRKQLHCIKMPALVMVGLRDWICPPSYSQLIVDSLDDAELFAVEGAGHGVHLEKNGAVLEKMRAFFSKQGSVR